MALWLALSTTCLSAEAGTENEAGRWDKPSFHGLPLFDALPLAVAGADSFAALERLGTVELVRRFWAVGPELDNRASEWRQRLERLELIREARELRIAVLPARTVGGAPRWAASFHWPGDMGEVDAAERFRREWGDWAERMRRMTVDAGGRIAPVQADAGFGDGASARGRAAVYYLLRREDGNGGLRVWMADDVGVLRDAVTRPPVAPGRSGAMRFAVGDKRRESLERFWNVTKEDGVRMWINPDWLFDTLYFFTGMPLKLELARQGRERPIGVTVALSACPPGGSAGTAGTAGKDGPDGGNWLAYGVALDYAAPFETRPGTARPAEAPERFRNATAWLYVNRRAPAPEGHYEMAPDTPWLLWALDAMACVAPATAAEWREIVDGFRPVTGAHPEVPPWSRIGPEASAALMLDDAFRSGSGGSARFVASADFGPTTGTEMTRTWAVAAAWTRSLLPAGRLVWRDGGAGNPEPPWLADLDGEKGLPGANPSTPLYADIVATSTADASDASEPKVSLALRPMRGGDHDVSVPGWRLTLRAPLDGDDPVWGGRRIGTSGTVPSTTPVPVAGDERAVSRVPENDATAGGVMTHGWAGWRIRDDDGRIARLAARWLEAWLSARGATTLASVGLASAGAALAHDARYDEAVVYPDGTRLVLRGRGPAGPLPSVALAHAALTRMAAASDAGNPDADRAELMLRRLCDLAWKYRLSGLSRVNDAEAWDVGASSTTDGAFPDGLGSLVDGRTGAGQPLAAWVDAIYPAAKTRVPMSERIRHLDGGGVYRGYRYFAGLDDQGAWRAMAVPVAAWLPEAAVGAGGSGAMTVVWIGADGVVRRRDWPQIPGSVLDAIGTDLGWSPWRKTAPTPAAGANR